MDVNVKVTVDLGDKTMSLFGGFIAANNAVTAAADTVLKKYADEPAEDKKPVTEGRPRNTALRAEREEPANEAAAPYTEDGLKNMSPQDLTAILKREFSIDPDDFDGKNTNRKLRDLILDAQAGKLEGDDEPADEPADEPEEDARPARNTKATDVTHDDIRDLMVGVIEADEDVKPKILKQLSKIGAKSVGTIKDEHVADFFEFLQSLKDA